MARIASATITHRGGTLGRALACGGALLAIAPVPALALTPVRAGAAHARAAAPAPSAHAAVVSGTPTDIAAAPWTAYIDVEADSGAWTCTGAILDATHVLTAAHCLIDDATGAVAPAADFSVYTGLSDVSAIGASSPYDAVVAASADPSYDPASDVDDVGVLELATPLAWSASVQPIALGPASGAAPGSSVAVSGFGLESPPSSGVQPDGTLNGLVMTVGAAGDCSPSFDALVGCASSPSGATCEGDSGSALTSTTSPPVLLGIVDAGASDASNRQCVPGFTTYFAKVTAPEIADFIGGATGPIPSAPRGGADIGCSVPRAPRVGEAISCTPGTWRGASALTEVFVDDNTQTVLATGSGTYALTAGDVGRRISFRVTASSAGGTATARTGPSPPIAPAGRPLARRARPSGSGARHRSTRRRHRSRG